MIFNKLKYKISLFVYSLCFFVSGIVIGQIEYPGYPVGLNHANKSLISFIELPSAEKLYNQSVENMKKEESLYKKDVFAAAVEVNVSPDEQGNWHTTDNNSMIWQLGITAEGASSLNLIFENFYLEQGFRLFVYSPDLKELYGAFTFRNNRKSRVFAISPVVNDSLIIELQVEKGLNDFGTLRLSKVGVGFPGENVFKSTEDEYYGWSANCHVDVNCDLSERIQRQKYSVCRYIYGGVNRCTGTLMNNTDEDGRPLILTAGHCILNDRDAESAVYFFDYESPYCDGPDGKIKSISGSSLLSRGGDWLDYSLVEMSEMPPADYYPLYAGWDTRDTDFDSLYIIHHPEGDVKKIATYNDSLQKSTFSPFDYETHWLITKYDIGTTEAGSSGAALFSSENRVIGTLTGGDDACTEYIYDHYQMLAHCWADYSYEDEQLKAWLDPSGSGAITIGNYAPVDPLYAVSEKLSNSGTEENDTNLHCSLGWGYITGHNHLFHTEYAEHFTMNGTKYVYALNMKISKLDFAQPDSKIKIKVWKDPGFPDDLIYEKEVYYSEMMRDQENFIRLDTLLYVNESFYIGYEISYNNFADTFALYTTIPETGADENTAFYRSAGQWLPLTDGAQAYSASLSIWPVVMNYYPPDILNPEEFPVHEVTLYPNPTYGNLQVLFKSAPSDDVNLKVYDVSGRLVLEVTKQSPEPNFILNTGNLNQGIYLLKITHSEKDSTIKFVKL